jgi:ketosteroid isomerase-like protein
VSRENVEVARRAFDAFNEGGVEGLLGFIDPGIEWTTTGLFVEAGTYRGHDGVRRYLGGLAAEFKDFRNDPRELIDAGEVVVAPARVSAIGLRSGAPVELELTMVLTVENARIVRIQNFEDREKALRFAGVEA